ncbi:MAG: hypothetical protein KAI47_27235 [Deltaproteobacteria bacterium]|nr:hypothetical protein [Deltaproteobacteria bacterium]
MSIVFALKNSVARGASLLATLAAFGVLGCGVGAGDVQPLDLKARLPSIDHLRVSAPGASGPAKSGSALFHQAMRNLNAKLAPLDLLSSYLKDGGKRDRGVSLLVALESPPHAADQVTRFRRTDSRLDVERVNDHAFYYLQVPSSKGYDPDEAISSARMVVDGGTFRSQTPGARPVFGALSGLASSKRGFLRVHFNRRSQDRDAVQDAVQLDYDLARSVGVDATEESLHLVFFRIKKVAPADGQLLAAWIRRDAKGGFVLQSELKGGKAVWSFLAQYKADGSHAVWGADGTLLGCYSGEGAKLGDAADPMPCDVFKGKFVSPPKLKGIWPGGLPSGVPR